MAVGARKSGSRANAILGHVEEHQTYWTTELATAIGTTNKQASKSAAVLINRGYLLRVADGCYKLTPDGLKAKLEGIAVKSGPTRPDTVKVRKLPKDTFRQRAWTSMRLYPEFTKADIVGDAQRGTDDPTDNLSWYLLRLIAAGYVAELPSRKPGVRLTSRGFKRYMLVKNTGRHAPVFQVKKGTLHDFNTGEDVPCNAL